MNYNLKYSASILGSACAVTAALLVACGGGGGGASSPPVAPTYLLGGIVSGLGDGAALTFANGSDSVSVSANGSFTFPRKLESGASYNVSVTKSPGYDCRLSNGAATVSKADVTAINVQCIPYVLAGKVAALPQPAGLAVDAEGNAYVADYYYHVIQKITPAGVVSIFAGAKNGGEGDVDGPAGEARFKFDSATSMIVDRDGSLIVADSCNSSIRKVTKAGLVSTVAGPLSSRCDSTALAKDGVGSAARFEGVRTLALDVNGDYLVGGGQNTLRRVTPAGVVSTILWTSPALVGSTDRLSYVTKLTVGKNGTIYALGSSSPRVWKISGGMATPFAGGGGATSSAVDGVGASASFASLKALTSDRAGNLYVFDYGVLRKISADGTVSSLAGAYFSRTIGFQPPPPDLIDGAGAAAHLNGMTSLAMDVAGNIVGLDDGIIRYVTPQGGVTTHPGTPWTRQSKDGAGAMARFSYYTNGSTPTIDAKGNIFVHDFGVVRMITPDGAVSRYAGTINLTGAVDGSTDSATLGCCDGMAADKAGNLYLMDHTAGLRKIGSGIVSSLLQRPEFGNTSALAISPTGNFAVAVVGAVKVYSPDGTVLDTIDQARITASFASGYTSQSLLMGGLVYDPSGNLFMFNSSDSVIHKLSKDGTLSTIAGKPGVRGSADGAPGTGTFNAGGPLTIDPNGNLYFAVPISADRSALRKITPSGVISTLPTPWENPLSSGVAYGNGRLYAMSSGALMQMWVP